MLLKVLHTNCRCFEVFASSVKIGYLFSLLRTNASTFSIQALYKTVFFLYNYLYYSSISRGYTFQLREKKNIFSYFWNLSFNRRGKYIIGFQETYPFSAAVSCTPFHFLRSIVAFALQDDFSLLTIYLCICKFTPIVLEFLSLSLPFFLSPN